jgi:membrane-bound lytic murein transglycosylase C
MLIRAFTTLALAMVPVVGSVAEEDPFAALDAQLESQFQDLDAQLEADYQAIDAAIEAAFARLKGEVEGVWGPEDAVLPTQSAWVDYSEDKSSRREFDFERGFLLIEQIIDGASTESSLSASLSQAVQGALKDTELDLTQKDDVLNYAKAELAAQSIFLGEAPPQNNQPVLEGLVEIDSSTIASEIEAQVPSASDGRDQGKQSSGALKVTTAQLANGAKKISVSVPFKADYLSESAKRYQKQVMIEAQRRGLPASLVYAIMETESHFNPRARSHIPAFGLMQLVPSSGGLDAYNYVYGEKLVLGPEYYFNPDQNVELGTAYLDLLLSRYLQAIEDEQSRVYCAIAAYNTGAGNVARSFTGNTSVSGAAPIINSLTPQEVFDHMVVNLPYEETRNYLKKVTKARERYRGLDQPSV